MGMCEGRRVETECVGALVGVYPGTVECFGDEDEEER